LAEIACGIAFELLFSVILQSFACFWMGLRILR